jgi:FimV-like protein
VKKYHFPALLALVLLSIVPLSQAQDHYGPVRRGRDLWDIARQVTDQHYKDANVSHTQVMLALLAANPSAFTAPCNANSPLHEGVVLTIPTVAQVQALNQEQAQQQFDQQRQQWEEAQQSGKPLVWRNWPALTFCFPTRLARSHKTNSPSASRWFGETRQRRT